MKRILFLGIILYMSCDIADPSEPGLLVPRTVDQDSSLPSISVNGTQLHAQTFGDSADPMLVMIHGGPGADYRSILNAQDFANDGFYVVFYDQRGTGLSIREDRKVFVDGGTDLHVDDLEAVISHYRSSPAQKVFLFGHSWGAMLATSYIDQHPGDIDGAILAEPGGFTWTQTKKYLEKANKLHLFSEELNDAIFPDMFFAGRSEHEILDYKSAYFMALENADGNAIGNAGDYPFWRNGAVSFDAMVGEYAEKHGFDFTQNLSAYAGKVLFLYSELNTAYGEEWARTVGVPYQDVEYAEVLGSGHEMLHFGWADLYPKALTYLNEVNQ